MTRALSLLILLATLFPIAVTPALLASPAGGAAGQDASLTWQELAPLMPLTIERSATIIGQAIWADPANPERLAYCAPESVQASEDGGASWRSIPTGPVLVAAAGSPNPLVSSGGVTPACLSVVLDPHAPGSVYATFRAGKAPFGAPPLVFVGYLTTDGGASWQAIATPDGASMEQFGGFRERVGAVQALFRPATPETGVPLLVEQTADGGRSWQAGALGCALGDPCLRWGAAPNTIGSCNMAARIQPVVRSSDGGTTFTPVSPPSAYPLGGGNACLLNEIVLLANGAVLLLREDEEQPLQRSDDGGEHWATVALPALPGERGALRGLQLLPDGTLFGRPHAANGWLWLAPGSDHWCAIAAAAFDAPLASADTVRVVGDRLWWLEQLDPSVPPTNATPTAFSAPLASLSCAAAGG